LDGIGKAEVPLLRAQYAANMACADEISAVCEVQAYLAAELIIWETFKEFWFFLQAQDANAVASGGQRS
jgi:hypothetical protein